MEYRFTRKMDPTEPQLNEIRTAEEYNILYSIPVKTIASHALYNIIRRLKNSKKTPAVRYKDV